MKADCRHQLGQNLEMEVKMQGIHIVKFKRSWQIALQEVQNMPSLKICLQFPHFLTVEYPLFRS